jgi:N-carbamoylputrescine amidase
MPPQTPAKYVVGLIQMSMRKDPEDNMRAALERAEDAARGGAQIICLPELYRSRYFPQKEEVALFSLAEPVPGPSTEAFSRLAKNLGVVIIVPIFERRAPGIYHNSAVILDADGSVAGLYRKMHIPDDPAYYEKFYFTPGDLGFRAFSTRFGRISTLICWDQWFPEAARLSALQGPIILFYPTAIGWHTEETADAGASERDAWKTVQRGHAIGNGIYVASVNRTGFEPSGEADTGIQFWGTSFVSDPQGVILAEASRDREEVLYAEVDAARLETLRQHWPFLRDRRTDAYGEITRRYLDKSP